MGKLCFPCCTTAVIADRLLHSVKTKLNDHIKQFKAAFRRREVPTNTGKLSVEEVTLCTLEAAKATNCE